MCPAARLFLHRSAGSKLVFSIILPPPPWVILLFFTLIAHIFLSHIKKIALQDFHEQVSAIRTTSTRFIEENGYPDHVEELLQINDAALKCLSQYTQYVTGVCLLIWKCVIDITMTHLGTAGEQDHCCTNIARFCDAANPSKT